MEVQEMKKLFIGMALFLLVPSTSAEEQTDIDLDWRAIGDQLLSISGPMNNKPINDFNKTLAVFDSAISQLPDRTEKREALETKGKALFAIGRYHDAIEAFDVAIAAADPDVPQESRNALLFKGRAFMQLGRFSRALESYDAASRINPPIQDPFAGMGGAVTALGRHDEAIGAYQSVFDIMEERNNVRTTYEMLLFQMSDRARLLAKLGKLDEALDTYDRAESITEVMAGPGNRVVILQEKAGLLKEMGMPEKAEKVRD
jgi:tetratricopeptide (TPR) repeat protein